MLAGSTTAEKTARGEAATALLELTCFRARRARSAVTAGRTAKVWASAANIAEGFLLGVSMRGYAFRACEMARRAWLARAYSPALRFPEKIGSNEKRFPRAHWAGIQLGFRPGARTQESTVRACRCDTRDGPRTSSHEVRFLYLTCSQRLSALATTRHSSKLVVVRARPRRFIGALAPR